MRIDTVFITIARTMVRRRAGSGGTVPPGFAGRLVTPRAAAGRTAVLMLLWLAAANTTASGALIRFKSPVVATGAVIRLQDIADIQDNDAGVVSRLGSLTVAPAPVPGRSLRLEYESIRQRLVVQGANVAALEFSGASVVTVSTPKDEAPAPARPQPPPVERPQPSIATETVQKRYEDLLAKTLARVVADQAAELGKCQIAARLTPDQANTLQTDRVSRFDVVPVAGRAWKGTQTIDVRYLDREGQSREMAVSCTVTPWPKGIVATRGLNRGQVLRADDIALGQVEPQAGRAPIQQFEAVIGQELRRSIRAGDLVSGDDLRPVPLMRRGDIVTVYSRRPGISIRIEAKAQHDGALGDVVSLVTLDGRQKLTARVVGFHEAEVGGASRSGTSDNSQADTETAGDMPELKLVEQN